MMNDVQKLKLHSPDLTQGNIDKLAQLFPNCVAEARDADGVVKRSIDFDQLRQELSGSLVEGPQERYQISWPGKREALLTANAPIAKTLRPCRAESVDFDTTQHLFIEGDNLDALKLLQETYLNKVKLIYIDPPYNTGNDFIYEDDFSQDAQEFFKRSNQTDEFGGRLVANAESNGRFHSDWLSMMYARLRLARNMLREDGVILVSIDDVEFPNLRRILDEIFGEQNFLATLVWDRNRKNDAKYFSVGHEYMVVYAKNESLLSANAIVFRGEKDGVEDVKKAFNELVATNGNDWTAIRDGLLMFYRTIADDDSRAPLKRFTKVDSKGPFRDDGNINWPGGGGPRYEILHPETKLPCKQPISGWRYPTPVRFWEEVGNGRIVFGPDETTVPRVRTNLFENSDQVMASVNYSYAQTSANEFNALFNGQRVFENPKPIGDLRRMIAYLTGPDDLICDFFAGSSTTAHAVFRLNVEDRSNRKFIMVQLPQPCDESHAAFQAGYKTIAELSRDRIRKAGNKIKQDSVDKPDIDKLDVGFRVLKIDSSNMKEVFYTPDAVSQDLLSDQVNNIREDRTSEDLLFQVLLDWGVDLALPIAQETIAGKAVFFVDGNAMAACFEEGVSEEFVKLLAKREPLRAVFRDSGFASDSVKINVEQIFKLMSPGTEVKTI